MGAIFALSLIGSSTLVLAFAILPVFVYLTIANWLDRYEPEPWWMIAGAFLWGASVAVTVSGIVNVLGSQLISNELGPAAGDAYGASISAPFIEETTKGAALLAVFLWRRNELNGLLDGIVYASMVGLGFAMTENLQYYGEAIREGVGVFGQTFVLRGVVLPFLHPLFTSMTGIGLVLALRARSRRTRILAPIVGLGCAMLLHSAWNTNPTIFGPLLILPVFVLMLVLIRRSIRHESKVVREYLPADAVPKEDLERLSSVRARFADSARAFKRGGFRGWAAREEYVSALSDLAFNRYRAATAAASPAQAGEDEGFRQVLASLRREWREPTS
jgi:RsiW-degrading membrane proteinase PrsW (M82 family)